MSKQRGKSINPANLQEFLDTAANATEGQMQFFTHPEIARSLARPLGRRRPNHAVVDFQMGRGDLLVGCNADYKLGIDIDASGARKPNHAEGTWSVYQADCHHWYALAVEAQFQSDLFVLNPPFGLQWHTERLASLKDSSVRHVRELWAHLTETHGNTTIDSTLATLMMATDRCSYTGEGYLIMNGETFDRWIALANEEEPWAHFVRHVWAQLRIPGPVWQDQLRAFDTAVLYFCRNTQSRAMAKPHTVVAESHTHGSIATASENLARSRSAQFPGRKTHFPSDQSVIRWKAIKEELARRKHQENTPRDGANHQRGDYNIYLDEDGRLCRYLTTFEELSGKIPVKLVRQLDDLKGKRPLQLVVQTAQRKALIAATRHPAWRVDPKVIEAVQEAVKQYEAQRAPFFQPNPVQSLGWIDEVDNIRCIKAIPNARFVPGEHYPLSTKTEKTQWNAQKTNSEGEKDELRLFGAELAVIIFESPDLESMRDPEGLPYAHHVFHVRESNRQRDEEYPRDTLTKKHHHVSELLEHFEIPQPLDVAQLQPESYEANLERLTKVEAHITRRINHTAA